MSSRTSKGQRTPHSGHTSTVVRRAFSMQEADAQLIDTLRVRCAQQGMLMNQSEVVRVALRALASMTDASLRDGAARLERLTTPNRAKSAP